jgi:hypothetical protein
MSADNDTAEKFHPEEYKMLRTKAQDMTRRIEELERNVIVACSAIFVFAVATFKPHNSRETLILYFLPLCVSLVGFLRYKGLAHYMREINEYTQGLETKLGGAGAGWLNYYYSPDRPRTDDHYRQYRVSIWYATIVFNILAGAILAWPLFAGR